MDKPQLTQTPVVKTGMLIRKPVDEVFEAFIDPDITSQFWFTKGSGRLVAGQQVQWEWEMFGISFPVTVQSIEPNQRILIEWPGPGGPQTVQWDFTSYDDGTTFVRITNAGFTGTGDELVSHATNSMQGFSLLLAGLKAYLEHNIKLNLVADHHPKVLEAH